MLTWAMVWLDYKQKFKSILPVFIAMACDCYIAYYAACAFAGKTL